MIEYKGYIGIFTFDEKHHLFIGKVYNCSDLITFQGQSIETTKLAFQDAIDDYLVWCKKYAKIPKKPLPIE